MTYIKKTRQDGTRVWKLYDDQNISEISSWEQVLDMMLENGTLPTVLMYEQLGQTKMDETESLSCRELYNLENRAKQLQKFVDQFENVEA